MSLVDDRYINEIFSDKISISKRRPYAVFAGCAAALIAVIAGIGILVSNSAESENITDLNRIRTEITVTESVFPYSEIDDNDETDYSKYFQSEYFEWDVFYNNEIGGRTYQFPEEYIEEIVPFEDFFEDGFGSAAVSTDKDGNAVHGVLEYCDLSGQHRVYINMWSKKRIYTDITSKPVKRNGVDVYGCDSYIPPFSDPEHLIGRTLYFYSGGTDYMMEFSSDFSHEEAVKLMDRVIESGFSPAVFDLSKGSKSDGNGGEITLLEANTIEPFSGYIPTAETVDFGNGRDCWMNVNFSEYYQNDEINRKNVNVFYQEASDQYEPLGAGISFVYDTDKSLIENYTNIIPFGELNREKFDSCLQIYKIDGEIKHYCCTIEAEDFYINVTSSASPDQIWSVLESIPANVLPPAEQP